MAVGGGVWGIGLSIVSLISLRFDAVFFLLLLLVIHIVVIVLALWRKTKSWRGPGLLVAGSLLFYFVYLSRFSIGIYLFPSAGLILLAGVLVIAHSLTSAIRKAPDTSSPAPYEAVKIPVQQMDFRLSNLTPREIEVLILIADGKSNKEIAEILVISPNTVRHHVHQLLHKLNCSSRGQAAVIAKTSGVHSTTESM
jgi:DNA-binding CsgD family transcriptional regulator